MDSPASTEPTDRRRHRRVPVKVYAELYWEGTDGRMNFGWARVADVSEGGVGLSLPGASLSGGVVVYIRIVQFGFAAFGMVHYARGDGILGVEWRFESATTQEVERWKDCVHSAQGT